MALQTKRTSGSASHISNVNAAGNRSGLFGIQSRKIFNTVNSLLKYSVANSIAVPTNADIQSFVRSSAILIGEGIGAKNEFAYLDKSDNRYFSRLYNMKKSQKLRLKFGITLKNVNLLIKAHQQIKKEDKIKKKYDKYKKALLGQYLRIVQAPPDPNKRFNFIPHGNLSSRATDKEQVSKSLAGLETRGYRNAPLREQFALIKNNKRKLQKKIKSLQLNSRVQVIRRPRSKKSFSVAFKKSENKLFIYNREFVLTVHIPSTRMPYRDINKALFKQNIMIGDTEFTANNYSASTSSGPSTDLLEAIRLLKL